VAREGKWIVTKCNWWSAECNQPAHDVQCTQDTQGTDQIGAASSTIHTRSLTLTASQLCTQTEPISVHIKLQFWIWHSAIPRCCTWLCWIHEPTSGCLEQLPKLDRQINGNHPPFRMDCCLACRNGSMHNKYWPHMPVESEHLHW